MRVDRGLLRGDAVGDGVDRLLGEHLARDLRVTHRHGVHVAREAQREVSQRIAHRLEERLGHARPIVGDRDPQSHSVLAVGQHGLMQDAGAQPEHGVGLAGGFGQRLRHALAPLGRRASQESGGGTCSGRWYQFGRLNYSVKDQRLTEGLLGVEYDMEIQ